MNGKYFIGVYRQSKDRNLAYHLLPLGAPSFFKGPMEVDGYSALE